MSASTPRAKARRRHRPPTMAAVLLWALITAPLLTWGLPSTRDDDLLFGGRPAWKAERYDIDATLRALRDRDAGADTDLNPLPTETPQVDLTPNDAARAEILRRYRLFSRQPDEMITLRALQRMRPRTGDLDPKLYQYGGGYIYLVGLTLGVGSVLGLVEVTRDAGYYLENPEAFATFYIAARAVSLVFGGLALAAVHKLARRTAGRRAGWIAMLCAAASPVFLSGVLEAKPHVPSACMLLWATLSALDYHRRGDRGSALRLGLQAGYAFGLVLTGVVGVLLWPVLLLTRRPRRGMHDFGQLAVAGLLAVAVYFVTNPYVPYHWLKDPASLQSNISNSTAMYVGQMARAAAGAGRVGQLLIESAGWGLPVAGLIGLAWLLRRYRPQAAVGAAAGVGMLVIAVLMGAGKPAEFARFLVLPVLLLGVAAGALLATVSRRHLYVAVMATIAVLGLMKTPAYLRSFIVDARGVHESRHTAGRALARLLGPNDEIAVLQEPAPYAVPPLDFAHRRVWLLRPAPPYVHSEMAGSMLPRWLVFTADDDESQPDGWWNRHYALHARYPEPGTALSPITWANKPVYLYRRLAAP